MVDALAEIDSIDASLEPECGCEIAMNGRKLINKSAMKNGFGIEDNSTN